MVCVPAILWILRPMILAHIQAGDARSEVLEVFSTIPGTASKEEIERIVTSGGHSHLRLVKVSPSEWLVETPLQFGAGNWVLWIEFEGQEIRALRVRTADSKEVLPERAPPDRTFRQNLRSSYNPPLEPTAE